MSKYKILQENQSYTFRSYCEMIAEPEDILADLGYTLSTARLTLPMTAEILTWEAELHARLERSLMVVTLTSETARRETLVAPILLEVANHCQAQLRIEYPLTVNNWLKGNLDYLLRSRQTLVVIEAKKDDLTRGFTQLAAELIALAQSQSLDSLYGAVTIGDAWRFGHLDAVRKTITQDIALFTIPDDLAQVMGILVGILKVPVH
jgi:hypothetical protein